MNESFKIVSSQLILDELRPLILLPNNMILNTIEFVEEGVKHEIGLGNYSGIKSLILDDLIFELACRN